MAYEINYNDKRFQQVNTEKQNAINEVDKTYGEMIGNSDKYYQAQIDASKQWVDKQTEIQNQQTDFAIQKIEQQKEQAQKDYTKEQSGAYVDWQKQSNQYGANAEQRAQQGLENSGYSESSQVAMYTAYQNRVATARVSFQQIVTDYNNKMTEARLQNSSALAEIAYKSQQEQLELALQGFQYKNQLVLEKANKKTEVENNYYKRYQDVLAQINQENALAEQIRQFNEDKALKEKQLAEEQRQYNQTLALQKAQLEEEKRQYNETLALQKSKSSSSGGSSSSKKSSSSSGKVKTSNSSSSSSSKAKSSTSTMTDATNYYNKMVSSGATKSQVVAHINNSVKAGELTQAQATELKKIFNPRGLQY